MEHFPTSATGTGWEQTPLAGRPEGGMRDTRRRMMTLTGWQVQCNRMGRWRDEQL